MRRGLGLVVGATAGVLASAGLLPAAPPTVIVKAARLVDGRGGPPLVPAMVRVEGDRIAAVATLLAGFTTCRDMGPTWPDVDVDLRGAIAEGAASRCYRPEAVFSNSFLYSP